MLFNSQGFDTFRADETLCDVILVPGDCEETFRVHRVIMASSSDYFKAMFTGELYWFIQANSENFKMGWGTFTDNMHKYAL